MEWDGIVQLIGDVEVPADSVLHVAAGTVVSFPALRDFGDWGDTPGVSEMIVSGTLDVNGMEGPVVFTSSADTLLVDWRDYGSYSDMSGWDEGDPPTEPAAAPGDWWGLTLPPGIEPDSVFAQVDSLEVRYASGALNFQVSTFPDLSNVHGTFAVAPLFWTRQLV
jgi:hypothetical protein